MDKILNKIEPKRHIAGFIEFIREKGVVGLAIGFMMGGAISKVVSALVTDIINPLVSAVLGKAGGLREAAINVGDQQILWGDFVSVVIDFIIIAAVVYFGFKALKLEKLDKKKEETN